MEQIKNLFKPSGKSLSLIFVSNKSNSQKDLSIQKLEFDKWWRLKFPQIGRLLLSQPSAVCLPELPAPVAPVPQSHCGDDEASGQQGEASVEEDVASCPAFWDGLRPGRYLPNRKLLWDALPSLPLILLPVSWSGRVCSPSLAVASHQHCPEREMINKVYGNYSCLLPDAHL